MKSAVLLSLLVAAVLLTPSSTTNVRKNQKRAVAPWVGWATFGINLGLAFVPHGQQLQSAIDAIVTDAGTTPFNIDALLSAIFSVVTASINLADYNSKNPVATQLNTLMSAITTLVVDAVNKNLNVLATDIDNVVCAAEAIGGLTKCNLSPLSAAINKLVSDAQKNASPATIVTDAFGIATTAVSIGSTGRVAANVLGGVTKLLTDINALVVDCVTLNTGAIGPAITTVVTDANALGSLL